MSALDAALPRRRLSALLPVGNYAQPAQRRAGMHDGETVDGSTVRLATAGVVAYAVASPLMNLWSYLRYPEDQFRPWIVVLVLAAVPLLAWLARAAAEAPFTRAQLVALAAALALTATVAVAEGPPRWIVLYVPAALVAVALPRVWSVVFLVGLLAVAVVVAVALGQANYALYYAVGMLIGVSPLVVSIRLVRSVRQLRAAREELAAQAIARERARIDEDLTAVVGGALADLAGRADRAARLLDTDPTSADGELRVLVADARRTLADARRVVRGYRDVSPAAELETAAALLAAAGIAARIEPGSSAGTPADPARRTALRQEVARLLETGSAAEVVLTVRDRRPGVTHREPG
ncbi:MAG: two-component system, NarL family, sensor histidine kinase DesK [Pseudonocardiales bacterium]|nr:two-component system, NarL family, sensor histidine kinase DesK [Pseudonocardiales bacterium]